MAGNKKLLAYRKWCALGDWIMALDVLKMVNIQFPDIDIYVNLRAKSSFVEEYVPMDLPPLVQEIIRNSNVKITGFTHYDNPEDHKHKYDYISGHMGYSRDGTPFIEDMVNNFAHLTGLNLQYDENILTQCISEPYVLIQSCTKRREKTRKGKDYGFNNMCVIADCLSNFINTIQIGQKSDWLIPNIPHCLDVNLALLETLMRNCKAFIGMDGGLGVYASHHGVKQFIIYEEARRFSWTDFPNRIQLDGSRLKPEQIGEMIAKSIW